MACVLPHTAASHFVASCSRSLFEKSRDRSPVMGCAVRERLVLVARRAQHEVRARSPGSRGRC
eukprot:7263034-Prymnesium_polylepis.1